MTYFRLIGQTTIFRVVRRYIALGDVPCVVGITLNGKRQTHARIADILAMISE